MKNYNSSVNIIFSADRAEEVYKVIVKMSKVGVGHISCPVNGNFNLIRLEILYERSRKEFWPEMMAMTFRHEYLHFDC
jgi:hypothetical protein